MDNPPATRISGGKGFRAPSLSLSHLSLAWNTVTAAPTAGTGGGLGQHDTMVFDGSISGIVGPKKGNNRLQVLVERFPSRASMEEEAAVRC